MRPLRQRFGIELRPVTVLLLTLTIVLPNPIYATFSIVAVDSETGEIGSAGATCFFDALGGALFISDVIPGVGAIHSQAAAAPAHKTLAVERMFAGDSPQEIIDFVVANDPFGNPERIQYGVVGLNDGTPRSAAFTGASNRFYAGHILGPNYAIQGNILSGSEILTDMEAAFLASQGSMADKLMAALQAANVVGADTRCAATSRPALSAFLRVARPDDDMEDLYLHLNVDFPSSRENPIDELQQQFNEWKASEICVISVGETPADCNANGLADDCEIQVGSSRDVNDNGTPDDCEVDCNSNGVPDEFEVETGGVSDRDSNGIPDSCDLTGQSEVVSPWVNEDVGTTELAGGARSEEDCLLVLGAEGGIQLDNDRFHFVYQKLVGDFRLTARIDDWSAAIGSGLALMVRESLDAGSRHGSVGLWRVSTRFRQRFRRRDVTDGTTDTSSHETNSDPKFWLRVERQGDTMLGLFSRDGQSWSEPDMVTLESLSEEVYFGVASFSTSTALSEPSLATICDLTLDELRPHFLRGDCNGDGKFDISDGVSNLNSLFGDAKPSNCTEACNVNDDAQNDVSDAVYVFNFLFGDGAPPAAPYPACGEDPEPVKSLGCGRFGCE